MIIKDSSKGLETSKRVKEIQISQDGSTEERSLAIVNEHYMDLYIGDVLAARLVCSPQALPQMVVGRLLTEQFIKSTEDVTSVEISEDGSKARVLLKEDIILSKTIEKEMTSANGNPIFVRKLDQEELAPLPFTDFELSAVFRLAEEFSSGSKIHKATKGAHCAYLWHKGEVSYAVEDIGRHNALDKAIGYMAMEGFAPSDCMLFTTGRVPTDMVKKAVAAGIPTLISKAVPTDKTIAMAEKYNLNLICRAWPDKVSVMARSK